MPSLDVVVPSAPTLTRWDRIELAHAGTWDIAVGGQQTFTPDDLAAAVAAVECPAVGRPVIKLGHLDDRGSGLVKPGVENRDGEPALGWISNMGLANNRQALVADLVGMPGWLGQIAASAYPSRSIEGARNFTCQLGHLHPFVISAVALLGLTPPGVGTLGSLQDHVRAVYGVAASTDTAPSEPFAVTFPATKEAPVPNPRPELVAAAVTVDELRTAFHSQSPWDYWITEIQLDPLQLIVTSDGNGETYRVPVTVGADGDSFTFGTPVAVEVTYVDSNENEPVAAAAAKPKPLAFVFASRADSRPGEQPQGFAASWPETAEASPQATPPAPAPTAPAVPAPAAQAATQTPEPAPAAPAAPAAEPAPNTPEGGTDVSLSEFRSRLGLDETADQAAVLAALDERLTPRPDPVAAAASAQREQQVAAAMEQIQTLSTELSAIKAREAATVKAAFFTQAVAAGRIRPADRPSWEARYDKAPDMVAEIVNAMAPGSAVPVAAAGRAGSPDEEVESAEFAEYDRMFPPSARTATTAKVG